MATALEKFEIYQGDTGPLWTVGFSDSREVDADYTCRMSVKGTAIARDISTLNVANTRFLVQLTPTETGSLAASRSYIVGIELRNPDATPPFVKETHVELVVLQQVVTE